MQRYITFYGNRFTNFLFVTHSFELKTTNAQNCYIGEADGHGGRQDDTNEGGYRALNMDQKGGWSYYEG